MSFNSVAHFLWEHIKMTVTAETAPFGIYLYIMCLQGKNGKLHSTKFDSFRNVNHFTLVISVLSCRLISYLTFYIWRSDAFCLTLNATFVLTVYVVFYLDLFWHFVWHSI